MLPKWKYPSKPVTSDDVETYVASLGGWPLSDEDIKLLDGWNKRYLSFQMKKFDLSTFLSGSDD